MLSLIYNFICIRFFSKNDEKENKNDELKNAYEGKKKDIVIPILNSTLKKKNYKIFVFLFFLKWDYLKK